jgi:predicted thioesterase
MNLGANAIYEPSRENLIGAVGIATMVTRPGDTAAANGDGDLAMLSTSFLLRMMESASHTAISEFLALTETSVTTQFECHIESVVGIGIDLNATATVVALDELNGNEAVIFQCEVFYGTRRVATGMLQREIVERVRYSAKVAALSVLAQAESQGESAEPAN